MYNENYACIMKAEHSLLSVSIKSAAAVQEPCTSVYEPIFDCLASVTQQLHQQEDSRVSRHPVLVLVLVLLLTFVSQCST